MKKDEMSVTRTLKTLIDNSKHPSRAELSRFLADIKDKSVEHIKTHVQRCKRCSDLCYMMDPELDH